MADRTVGNWARNSGLSSQAGMDDPYLRCMSGQP